MKIYVDLDHVDITEYTQIESGEYNTNKINFIFTPEYKDLVKVAIFGSKLDTDEPKFYKIYLSDDSCYLPSEVTTASDVISIGVYAFNVENGELKLRYSPTPVKTIVYEGSFREEAENSSSPTPTEIEQIMSRIISLEEITSDLNTRVEALENKACDLDSIKEDVAELKDDVENISGRLDTVESDIDDLEGDLANTYSKTEVDTLLGSTVDTTTFNSSQAAQDEKIAKAELILSQLPKVTGEGTNFSLSPTIEYDLEVGSYKGDTTQATSILPSEYQQVEYIASDGLNGQYIDTGYKPNDTTGIYQMTSKPDQNDTMIIGCREDTGNTRFLGGTCFSNLLSYGWKLYLRLDTNGGITSSTTNVCQLGIDEVFEFYMNFNNNRKVRYINKSRNLDVTSTQDLDTYSTTFNYNMYIFAYNRYGSVASGAAKIYKLKISEGTTLVRDFIPCYRISDNVIGLYDLIGKQFYTNSGSGSFTKGSNVSIPNPNYPQDIQVVTGTQEVTISNADNTESQTYTLHLGDLELAKIGSYQDYIYYNNGKWYKDNEIGKIIIDNSHTWTRETNSGWASPRFTCENLPSLGATSQKDFNYGFCNYGSISSSANYTTVLNAIRLRYINNNNRVDCMFNLNSIDELQTILTNSPMIIYYQLVTPSSTEITNETLLSDLEYIRTHAMSYSGTTNISTSGDLPIIISASALKQLS